MTEAIVVTPASGGSTRARKMLFVGLAVVLVLYVVPKFLLGGGGDDAAVDDVSSTAPAGAAPAPAAPDAPVAETLHTFSAKNPFTPLFSDVAPGDAAPPATPAEPAPAVSPSPEPIIVDTGEPAVVAEPTATPAPSSAPAAKPAPAGPVRFGLVQVGQDASGMAYASVRVDGGVFQAVEGQEFGGHFKVVSLDAASRCGVFLYGDQRFSLCEGEETTT